jgi:hypothetical protein
LALLLSTFEREMSAVDKSAVEKTVDGQ